MIQPLPSLPEHEQRALLKGLSLAEIYVLGRDCTHEDIIRQQREGRALAVPWAAVAARQRGKKDARYASLLEFRDEIHAKGGHLLEVATNLRSDSHPGWRKMRTKAAEMLSRIAQGSKSAANARRGRVGYGHDDKAILAMLRVMDSRRYTNDRSRITAIAKLGIKPVPGRTWLATTLKLIARERGLI